MMTAGVTTATRKVTTTPAPALVFSMYVFDDSSGYTMTNVFLMLVMLLNLPVIHSGSYKETPTRNCNGDYRYCSAHGKRW